MNLRYSRRALRHLEGIRAYLLEHGPDAAGTVLGRLASTAALLREFPYLGRETSVPDTHVIVVSGLPYLVVYRIDADEASVVILGIFHAAQNPRQ